METKKEELLRFLSWMAEYPNIWWVFSTGDYIDTATCREMTEQLMQKGFWLLIPAVVGRTKSIEMENMIHKLCLKKLQESWGNLSEQELLEEIMELLTQAAERDYKTGDE